MKEFKGTKGRHTPIFSNGCCIGVGVKLDVNYYQMTANSILPDTDKEYEAEKEEIEANMRLYAAAPDLLHACQNSLEQLELQLMGDSGTANILRKAINKALNV